jgi:hypothetical protein
MTVAIQVICQAAPDNAERQNEDAYVLYQRDDRQPAYILAVIDGATSLVNFAPLQAYLQAERPGMTPAGLAATVIRDSVLRQIVSADGSVDVDPRQLILNANQDLRALLEQIVPEIFDAEEILRLEPQHEATLQDDPRRIRLFLPAAVMTLMTIDTEANLLRYAHTGDTALMLCYHNGHVSLPTQNRIRMGDEAALIAARQAIMKSGRPMLEAINDPLIQALNRDHRLYHNYVDEQGATQPGTGAGVINGLPELRDYVETGFTTLEQVAAGVIMSDGFFWPAPLNESRTARQQRHRMMATRIRQEGVGGYLAALRAEERADASREKYPRFKLHDDATGLVFTLNTT